VSVKQYEKKDRGGDLAAKKGKKRKRPQGLVERDVECFAHRPLGNDEEGKREKNLKVEGGGRGGGGPLPVSLRWTISFSQEGKTLINFHSGKKDFNSQAV